MAITKLSSGSSFTNLTKYNDFLAGNPPYIPSSYESIATTTVGSGGSSSVTFSSIPSTYTHLQIRLLGRTTNTADPATCPNADFLIRFNGDTGSNYALHLLYGNSTSATGYAASSQAYMFAGRLTNSAAISSNFGISIIDVLDYANTNKYKTARILTGTDNNGTGTAPGFVGLESGLWQSTTAISSITLLPVSSANFEQYSQFALYGIKGA